MIRNYENKKLKIELNTPLRGYPRGFTLNIKVDKNGIPVERYWRDRLKDSQKDNCITINGGD